MCISMSEELELNLNPARSREFWPQSNKALKDINRPIGFSGTTHMCIVKARLNCFAGLGPEYSGPYRIKAFIVGHNFRFFYFVHRIKECTPWFFFWGTSTLPLGGMSTAWVGVLELALTKLAKNINEAAAAQGAAGASHPSTNLPRNLGIYLAD